MKISVIIPTFNEERVIGECLNSLGKQSFAEAEIIVVDDGSTDLTPHLTKRFDVAYYSQKHKGPGAARNLGAKHSKGDILVFVDADMTFDKDFVKVLVGPIVSGRSKGTFSKEEYVSNWENVWARYWNLNQGWEEKRRHPKNYPDKQKVFRAILKTEFDRVGGFTPGGYTDDYSLYEKLGYMATNTPAVFYHRNPDTLGEVFKQVKWTGKREYKFGVAGKFVGLIRAFFPVSLVVGLIKSVAKKEPSFLIFKIVYDFGIFLGILEQIFLGKQTK